MGEHGVLALERARMEVAEIGEAHAVVTRDVMQAIVQLVWFLLCGDVDDGARFRHDAEPVAGDDGRDRELLKDQAFADGTLAAQQRHLFVGDAVEHGPLALGNWLAVPGGHVNKVERLLGFLFWLSFRRLFPSLAVVVPFRARLVADDEELAPRLVDGLVERAWVFSMRAHAAAPRTTSLKSLAARGVSRITSRSASVQRSAHRLAAAWPAWLASLSTRIVKHSMPGRIGKLAMALSLPATQAGCS